MTIVVICAGGPSEEVVDLTQFQHEQTVFIGADRGALHLLAHGIVPREAIGDFDSVSAEDYEKIRQSVEKIDAYQAEKNETDTELAMERALAYAPKEVILTGVTGGRLDHMMSAIQLLYRFQKINRDVSFKIYNKTNMFTILHPGQHRIVYDEKFHYVSFFSFQRTVTQLTLKGFKYEVEDEMLRGGMTKFTSNELLEQEGSISFREGICLMVRSSDA